MMHRRVLARGTFAIIGMLTASLPALAQDAAAPATPNWRPKPGIYAASGKNFKNNCDEQVLAIDLAQKKIDGPEWNCKVVRLTDTGPGTLKLDMTCDDINLAAVLNEPTERIFKEIMLLKKIDENDIIARRTNNGKFTDPEYRVSYCPRRVQRWYIESEARSKAEAKQSKVEAAQKAAEEKLRLNPWRPQEGVYARPGADFNDRCMKAGDATIELSERSISSGSDKCSVTFIRDEPNNVVRLFVACNKKPNAQRSNDNAGDGGSQPARPSSETILLSKVDDKTVALQKSKNGTFTDPGQHLSYCSPDAQKIHAQEKAVK
jgi:hypothetical protein